MAKNTKMAEEASKMSAEELAARTYMADEKQWDGANGDEFGGQADILTLQVGEIAGPLTYVGHQSMTTNLGETTVHVATDKEGESLRCPIQATFQRAVDQADLQRGDTFLVRRHEDQIKKNGKGAGNPMSIYALKVLSRAPRQQTPA